MRLFLQSSDPRHLTLMADALTQRNDTVQTAADLAGLRELARKQPVDGVVLELSEEAVAWVKSQQSARPEMRAVFLTPREEMGTALGQYPGLSILPTPGTALAARFLLSANPAEDLACSLGDYQLLELDALGRRTHIFQALQRSIHRPVVLRLLNQELEEDDQGVAAFLDDARAKAAVTHDRVGTVFQALEDMGAIFYTAERLDGATLADHARHGGKLDARQFLEVARTLASAMAHFQSRHLSSAAIELRHIHLADLQDTPRLANQATQGEPSAGHHGGILRHSLGLIVPMLDPADPASGKVAAWADGLLALAPGSIDPAAVINDIRHLLGALESDEEDAREAAQPPGKSPRTLVAAVAGITLVAAVAILVMNGSSKAPPQREVADTDAVVSFPGGDFTHPERGGISLSPFSIDKYEVTIRQYSEFLEATAAGGQSFAHPEQQKQRADKKDYKPKDWDIWWPIARDGGNYEGRRLTLDCPVFNVTWWDAYAYARWKNRRLPTEDEWELAARGPEWRKFPWGNSWDPAKVNGADKPAPLEGHEAWAPVDLPEGDRGPEGVHGLGGGVSEWTGSESVHPEDPNRTIPVVKGGSFITKGEIDPSKTVRILNRNEQKPWLGFRTAADLPRP